MAITLYSGRGCRGRTLLQWAGKGETGEKRLGELRDAGSVIYSLSVGDTEAGYQIRRLCCRTTESHGSQTHHDRQAS